jgi:hypothetical protein
VYNQIKEERHANSKEEDSEEEDSEETRQEEDSKEGRKEEEEVSPRVAGFSLLSSWYSSSARAGDRNTDDLRREG